MKTAIGYSFAWIVLLTTLMFGVSAAIAKEQTRDPLARFRTVEAGLNGGQGYSVSIPAGGAAGDTLAWGASYLWQAYLHAYEVSGDVLWLDKLIRDFDTALSARDDGVGLEDYRGEVGPVWGSTGYTDGVYYAWLVHNGVATYPMARFVEIVRNDSTLDPLFHEKADRYLSEIRRTVHAFDEDWREGPGPGQGYYVFPDDMPDRVDLRGRKLPLNQQNAMGLTYLVLADITGEEIYKDRAERLAAYFYSVIKRFPNGAYVWTYWGDFEEQSADAPEALTPEEAATVNGEDISHAAINTLFAYEAYRRGVVFTEDDMRAMARAITENIWAPQENGRAQVYHAMSGSGALHTDNWLLHLPRGWLYLSQFDPRVYRIASRLYEALPVGTSSTYALAAVSLDRWEPTPEGMLAVLQRGARSGDPLAPTHFVDIVAPRHLEQVTGPLAVEAHVARAKPLSRLEIAVDGDVVYAGPSLPKDLVLNQGELADGGHTLTVRAVAASGDYEDTVTVGFVVQNVKVLEPAPGARVNGEVPIRVETGIPRDRVEDVHIEIDGKTLYSGSELPNDLWIDTFGLDEGFHKLVARVRSTGGALSSHSVNFRVENYWHVSDALQPPIESGWFGAVDRSKTSDESQGWTYATDLPEDVFGDADRKVRTADTQEYLTWEASDLVQAVVTLYAKEPNVRDVVRFHISPDGSRWHELHYELRTDAPAESGWYRLILSAEPPVETPISYFRVTLQAGKNGSVQLGQVELKGLMDPDSQ